MTWFGCTTGLESLGIYLSIKIFTRQCWLQVCQTGFSNSFRCLLTFWELIFWYIWALGVVLKEHLWLILDMILESCFFLLKLESFLEYVGTCIVLITSVSSKTITEMFRPHCFRFVDLLRAEAVLQLTFCISIHGRDTIQFFLCTYTDFQRSIT